jgi:hypothetical protein
VRGSFVSGQAPAAACTSIAMLGQQPSDGFDSASAGRGYRYLMRHSSKGRAPRARGSLVGGLCSWSGAALLLACTGAADATSEGGGGRELLHEGKDRPYTVAVDDRYVYWASLMGLRQAPVDGGDPVTLGTLDEVYTLVPRGDHVYFRLGRSDQRGQLGRVGRESGDVEWFVHEPTAEGLVVSADGVFWSARVDGADGRLLRAGLDGSAPTELATGLVSPRFLALEGEQLYFVDGDMTSCSDPPDLSCLEPGLFRVSTSGGVPERVATGAAISNPVWNGGATYWLEGDDTSSVVMRLTPGGTAQPIVTAPMDRPFLGNQLASDDEALYLTDGTNVLRMPFATGELELLVTGLEPTSNVAPRGSWVYVAERTHGRIVRVAKDGSGYDPAPESFTGPCPAPVGSLEELALTPRADPNLELLTFELEPNNVVASQATYDRLVSDVTAIRALRATLSDVAYLQHHDGRRIQLELRDAAGQAFVEGRYTAWACLNEAYEPRSVSMIGAWVSLEFDGIYNLERIIELYQQLPGVTSGAWTMGGLDGPTICVSREAERYEYVFHDTGEFCPEPCPEHRAYHFASETSGQVTELATWDSTTGAPAPRWFSDVCGFQPRISQPLP